MKQILVKAHKGIDMNLLAFHAPDRVYHSNSCPAGLEGYSNQGHAWRLQIPETSNFDQPTINLNTLWLSSPPGLICLPAAGKMVTAHYP
jgi:hypothetical protein